ncbi:class I SAM-dependent methyltransferase [Halorussus salinisoli]|uniref:class I SAM-dependent methyltransferase n=1 Tax=Halorussus salinisoli TaxID=2558242 RepID=UPI0010C204C2|nr:class I SAM-dependent methyltransferase [Halorussus salinisoli]
MTDQKRAVRDGYDQLASEYDARRSDDPDFLDEFRARLPAGGRVLDAGCGAGRPVAETVAREYDLVGLDLSREQVGMARERVPDGRFVQGDMTGLPYADESFDGIVAYHSVIHVPTEDHPTTVREFSRVLRPGGHLLMTIGASEWEGRNDDWLDTGVEMRWSVPGPEESESMLEDAEFEVVWRRVVDDELGGETCFVLARKSTGANST